MTLSDKHHKHVTLSKPAFGEFGRNELAILGAPCGVIQELARVLAQQLSPFYSLAFVDMDHQTADLAHAEEGKKHNVPASSMMMEMTDKILFTRFDLRHPLSSADKRSFFNKEDLVLVNGNHFKGKCQILIIDPAKNLEKKLDQLIDVKLILLKDSSTRFPDFLKDKLLDWQKTPTFYLEDTHKITGWIKGWLDRSFPPVKGLVLAGGESKRMKRDKSSLNYHGKSQREHVLSLIQPYCVHAYLSCNAEQVEWLRGKFPFIADAFLNLGPMGGILSAMRMDPNAAWLAVACDLPYLSKLTLEYLIAHRNPSKIATAFLDPEGVFPEPLVTLWEPRSYPVLLQYLSQGYSCPRKVLINSEVELLVAPDKKEFYNVNHPGEYEEVLKELKPGSGPVVR